MGRVHKKSYIKMEETLNPLLEFDEVTPKSESIIRLTKNTKGVNWEIKVVRGTTDGELDMIRKQAILQHEALLSEFGE